MDTGQTREDLETLRGSIQGAVRVGDDDLLASLVETLREMTFIEVRRVLDRLDKRELRRVAETAIAPSKA